MAAKSNEEVSVREFGRRMGVSDTAVRNEIYDKKTNANGCLRAGVKTRTAGSQTRPVVIFEIAYAEWLKAGRTIKNPEYFPTNRGDGAKKLDELNKGIEASKLKEGQQTNPIAGTTDGTENPLGFRSLIFPGMNTFEAAEVKDMYDAGLKEIAYFKLLGKLAPVERVKFVLYEYGKTIKTALLQIPARCADRVRAAKSDREAQDLIYTELEAVLYMLSQGPAQSMDENAKDEFDEDAEKYDNDERGDTTGTEDN